MGWSVRHIKRIYYIILTEKGPTTARTIRRMEDHDKYDLDMLNKVIGKPLVDSEEDQEEDSDVDLSARVACKSKENEEGHNEDPHVKRRWKTTKEDIENMGPRQVA